MANRFNRRNLRRGTGESAYNPEAAYNPDTFAERVESTREQHTSKSTADEISDDLERVRQGLDTVKKALDGDEDAREAVAKGFDDADDEAETDDVENAVEKAARAAEAVDAADPDVPDLPQEDYSGVVDLDDGPTRLRKSTDTVGDVTKAVDDTAPDRNGETSTRNNDDAVAGNSRLRRTDDGN